jgi:oligopeptide/dipeptide ABC transporter ATP-binding protein
MAETPAVSVTNLTKRFVLRGSWRSEPVVVHAVESVTLSVESRTTLGIVGESGCGKTTLGRMVAGLLVPTAGWVQVNGVKASSRREILHHLRGHVQMVFQDPAGALDPRMTLVASVAEALANASRSRARQLAFDMLDTVGVSAAMARRLPHELSGGQQQRACIARALVGGQQVVVLDEVVSALDPVVRAQILDLLADLRRELGLTYLFISHDLYAVQAISTHVAVMYLGELIEYAPMAAMSQGKLQHPYSVALLSSRLEPRAGARKSALVLAGDVPSPLERPSGCVFRTRCPIARAVCAERQPELREVRPGHMVACLFPGELSVEPN